MNIIQTNNLSYSYDNEKMALDKVSIKIKKGSVTAFIGGNGSGKSTLFLNLNGVLKPKSGEVYYYGKKITYSKAEQKELRKKIGIVFQDPNDQLFSEDVFSDITFGPLNLGMPEDKIKIVVDKIIEKLNIGHFKNKPIHALSFGEKKRVAIAGVLAMEPEILILDELTAGLDPSGVSDTLKLMLKLKNENNLTILLSTHDMDIVALYCDYVYVLNNGRVVLEGTFRNLVEKAKEIRMYSLRLPRLAHLMEILTKKDKIPVDCTAATISEVRQCIKVLLQKTKFIRSE